MFSVSMSIFVLWVLLSYRFIFLLVHYTELRLRLVYQFTSYCEHLSLVKSNLVNRTIKITHAHNLHVNMLVFGPFTIRTLKEANCLPQNFLKRF